MGCLTVDLTDELQGPRYHMTLHSSLRFRSRHCGLWNATTEARTCWLSMALPDPKLPAVARAYSAIHFHGVGGSLGARESGSLRAPESGSLGTPKNDTHRDIRDT